MDEGTRVIARKFSELAGREGNVLRNVDETRVEVLFDAEEGDGQAIVCHVDELKEA